MPSLVKTALILSFARMTNYALLLFSPLILVRVLDVQEYGQYREFLLYASVLVMILGLAIKDNLIFTIPRHPEKAAVAASQTANMLLVTTAAGLLVIGTGQEWFLSGASFDFGTPLILYVFFFLSHDILENYWLARQQPTYVLVFSTLRTLFRVLVVLTTAYVSRNVADIITAIVVAEIIKWLVSVAILTRLKLLPMRLDRKLLKEQIHFIVPLSAAGLILFVNERAGHLFVSATLGVSALAIYTVGTYQLPVIAVVRSAVADTLFPEMVRRAALQTYEGLELWKTATLYYLVLVLPVVVVLMYLADLFVQTLFTSTYLEAADVFRFALLVMLRQCFEMGTPLRAINANKHMLAGNVVAMCVHLPLLFLVVPVMGIAGAALAWVVADLVASVYMAQMIRQRYAIAWTEFARWRKVGLLVACAAVAAPVLWLERLLPVSELLRAICVAAVYLVVYLMLVKLAGIEEMVRMFDSVRDALMRRRRDAPAGKRHQP
jgi:O-antigen/teichoic acid export membrane protein